MNAEAALLIDFGSTYTKLRAVDLERGALLGSSQGPSTVQTDMTIGMLDALARLERKLGRLPDFKHRLASSSAAGGLKMVTIGLVKELTAEAARQAALGAGARLVATFANRLSKSDLDAIRDHKPDILLLAGGTDGGNADVILHNAGMLAGTELSCPIIVAGNRAAADQVADILRCADKYVRLTSNVMPMLGELDIEPARAAIRDVFVERIVSAKGLDRAQSYFDSLLMPTPAAVLEATRLLCEGTPTHEGLGPLLVIDVGGATTDVHSATSGDPTGNRVLRQGLPDPFLMRTVEGDLGMRHNASALGDIVGKERIAAQAGCSLSDFDAFLAAIAADVEALPSSPGEAAMDAAMASAAVRISVARHAGKVELLHTVNGPVTIQRGKDLGLVTTVIGTGGALVHAPDPSPILASCLYSEDEPVSLRPRQPTLLVDRDYSLFAAGLLAAAEPESAYRFARASLRPTATAAITAKDNANEPFVTSR